MGLTLVRVLSVIIIFLQSTIQIPSSCQEGTFYFELTDACENCQQGCSSCNGFHYKDCQGCMADYYKIQLDKQFLCTKCPEGQFFDSTNNICVNCDTTCRICVSLEICLVCQLGYIQDSNFLKCDPVNCQIGFFRNQLTNKCQACSDQYAISCHSVLMKIGGINGKTVVRQISDRCKSNLQLTYICSCSYGQFLDSINIICKPCLDPNCTVCDSYGLCIECLDGFSLYQQNCILQCDKLLQYTSQSYYSSRCYNYLENNSIYSGINNLNNKQFCINYYGFKNDVGCYVSNCRPFEFKLYDPDVNGYNCVKYCPINYTLDYQTLICIPNNCSSSDITQKINNVCYFRSCPLGQYFLPYQGTQYKSQCVSLQPNCLDQTEESGSCSQCKPSYFINGVTCTTYCGDPNFQDYTYVSIVSCQTCDYSNYTDSQKLTCAQSQKQYPFIVDGNKQYSNIQCPEGYTSSLLVDKECVKCSNEEIFCSSNKMQYVCEWGQNNTKQTCDDYDLSTLINQGFDSQGFLVNLSTTDCLVKNPDESCAICGPLYNYNFKGVCSQGFARKTKYYVYYNKEQKQYVVVDSCTINQFVFRLNSYLRVCKDFAYCLQIKTDPETNQEICEECSPPFYNLNNNCIESCPDYTYTNKETRRCEFTIENCLYYLSVSAPNLLQCQKCKQGYIRSSDYTSCNKINECNQRGTFFNATDLSCMACSPGCDECDTSNKCLQPKTNYVLLYSQAVTNCPDGYYLDGLNCQQCSQFCKHCNSKDECIEQEPGFYYRLIDSKVFYYYAPICQSNQYYDESTNSCLPCDPTCLQCYKTSKQCLICSNNQEYLLDFQCLPQCPSGYIGTTVQSQNYTRLICKKCEIQCLQCQGTEANCTKCNVGYSKYDNQCLLECPNNYYSVNYICYKQCGQGFYNIDEHNCGSCKLGCLECKDGNTCTKCPSNFSLYQGDCLSQCPTPYFKNNDINECQLCGSQNCAICQFQNNIGTCQQCADTFLLDQQNMCIQCKINEYFDNTLKVCNLCDTSCNQCTGTSTECITCKDANQFIFESKCVDSCPLGYYIEKEVTSQYTRQVCKKCDPNCLNSLCSKESTLCTLGCKQGYYSYQNKCVVDCPLGFEPRNFICYKVCEQGFYNSDIEICSACNEKCLECVQQNACTKCKDQYKFQQGNCVTSCDIPYFELSGTKECVTCGSRACVECDFQNQVGKCVACKKGYELNQQNKCMQQEQEQEKPKTQAQLDDETYLNKPITYTGKVYQGSECHFSCKQCKGSGPSNCLSCFLSTRVLFQDKYCICADGYQEDGIQQSCNQQNSSQDNILKILDTVINWLVLLSTSLDKVPILTFMIIDTIQVGSYSIYLEEIYNYAGKLPILQTIYQSNFSRMIPSFIINNYIVDAGVYKSKKIVESDGDEDRELPLIFNDVSFSYILNSFPFLLILGVSLISLVVLKVKNNTRFQIFFNKFMVLLHYITFQDQILFIGLQLKNVQTSNTNLFIPSIIGLSISTSFNIFMIYRAILLEKYSFKVPVEQSEQFKKLFLQKSMFLGLFAKSLNAISVIVTGKTFRAYIFLAVIAFQMIFKLYILIKNKNEQSKLFFAIKLLIILQLSYFIIPSFLNAPNISDSLAYDLSLHSLLRNLCTVLVIEKLIIFSLEAALLFMKNVFYNKNAGYQVCVQNQSQTQQDTTDFQGIQFTQQDIDLILQQRSKKISWK